MKLGSDVVNPRRWYSDFYYYMSGGRMPILTPNDPVYNDERYFPLMLPKGLTIVQVMAMCHKTYGVSLYTSGGLCVEHLIRDEVRDPKFDYYTIFVPCLELVQNGGQPSLEKVLRCGMRPITYLERLLLVDVYFRLTGTHYRHDTTCFGTRGFYGPPRIQMTPDNRVAIDFPYPYMNMETLYVIDFFT